MAPHPRRLRWAEISLLATQTRGPRSYTPFNAAIRRYSTRDEEAREPISGIYTPHTAVGRKATSGSIDNLPSRSYGQNKSKWYFDAGYALHAKRPSRPFPSPFLVSSTRTSDESTTNKTGDSHSTRDKDYTPRATIHGDLMRGTTNGDDAVLMSENFICANDGVGAWATRERGHAGLWARLLVHFWSIEADREKENVSTPDTRGYLQRAYERTQEATSGANECFGTTTACGALLVPSTDTETTNLYVTQLGDSQILVIRPRDRAVVFKTTEQWHWFDCPRQLGTNSPDTPDANAVDDTVHVEEEDIVLAMSDGVIDNLWEHEVVEQVMSSLEEWQTTAASRVEQDPHAMRHVARELVKAARVIAEDLFAESPFMQRAVEEGLSIEGGKMDDISVVAAMCRRRKTRLDDS